MKRLVALLTLPFSPLIAQQPPAIVQAFLVSLTA